MRLILAFSIFGPYTIYGGTYIFEETEDSWHKSSGSDGDISRQKIRDENEVKIKRP